MAATKWFRVRVPFRWTDPRNGDSKEFYEVGSVHAASAMPEPEKHLRGVDHNGPLIEETAAPASNSTEEK